MDTFFWIVELKSGKVISEYDIETGKKNQWRDVPVKEVKRLIWHPYTLPLIDKIQPSSIDERVASSPVIH